MSDLVGVQEVRWDRSGTGQQANIHVHFSTERGMRIISAVMMVEFVSDRMSYIILRGRWCDTTVLKVHAPTTALIHLSKNLPKLVFEKYVIFQEKVSIKFGVRTDDNLRSGCTYSLYVIL
jgi:hypothetical protein